jgi:hypothetical protein
MTAQPPFSPTPGNTSPARALRGVRSLPAAFSHRGGHCSVICKSCSGLPFRDSFWRHMSSVTCGGHVSDIRELLHGQRLAAALGSAKTKKVRTKPDTPGRLTFDSECQLGLNHAPFSALTGTSRSEPGAPNSSGNGFFLSRGRSGSGCRKIGGEKTCPTSTTTRRGTDG